MILTWVLQLQLDTWTILVVILCFIGLILKETVMGGKSSKGSGRRHVSSYDSAGSSSSWENYGIPQQPYGYPSQNSHQSTPLHHRAPPATAPVHDYAQPKRRLDRRYSRIADDYHSLDEVRSIQKLCCCDLLVCNCVSLLCSVSIIYLCLGERKGKGIVGLGDIDLTTAKSTFLAFSVSVRMFGSLLSELILVKMIDCGKT